TWERVGNRVLLRERTYAEVADPDSTISLAVGRMSRGAIVESFDVQAYGPDSAAVIDVTELFTTTNTNMASLTNVQRGRSFINHVSAFPENVEVEATQTGVSRPTGAPSSAPTSAETAVIHWSFYRLPEDPMMPRWRDTRVGFISSSYVDYSAPEHRAETRTFIHRFRLEKQDPAAALSDPVRPIIYWIDPATPEWLVPWVKQGIEEWQPAFEEAGFSNAIFGRLAPTPQEDPDWSIYDGRHSIVYWRPSTIPNATGGQVVDPRTGEILKGEVNMYHNVMNLLRNWYFTQVGPLDPRAQELPLPDSLMGRLVQYVVTHEIGHSIGFPHNMKSSSQYPADSLRSESFLRRMGGHVATLMDYSRFNYVAQPEDNIPVELLIPNVGPYDKFAVHWGYAPIPGAASPEDELPVLDRWARVQDTVPWFRFSTPDSRNDPGALTEAVGDGDAVKSSELGLRNIRRVMDMLIPVSEVPGRDYSLLEELYENAVQQWGRYMNHVAAIVGGAESQERYGTGPRFVPVSRERQREAVAFLNENAFSTPEYFVRDDVLRRIETDGLLLRLRSAQGRVLSSLLNQQRLDRLIEYEAMADGAGVPYTVAELVEDLRSGVWSELQARRVSIDVFRRNLQRAYLEAVDQVLNPPEPRGGNTVPAFMRQPRLPASDVRAVLRNELLEIDALLERGIAGSANSMTRVHLRDLRMEIERILDTND
ncbi:MAG: zinc-dependent metalloprotease, partial [Gemmatimonadota bacterium]|nr:zinc-dependent metalloprotease [Gemmatimonadota bacterium]